MEQTPLFELFRSFFKIGMFTFGGGYAMVPLIEAEVIERRRWLAQNEFLDLLTLAQSSPGPIAINTSVFIGYKVRGLKGAIAASLGATLPSFLIILVVAIFFAGIRHNPVIDAAFKGMRPAVVALIVVPVFSLARGMHPALAGVVAAVALIVWRMGWSPVLFIAAGALVGIVWALTVGKKAKQKS
jgi:chromate transporter